MTFTDIPIADTVQIVRTDKHNQSNIVNKSILLYISCKNKVRAIPKLKGSSSATGCRYINTHPHLVKDMTNTRNGLENGLYCSSLRNS